jgi:hypothetical protein
VAEVFVLLIGGGVMTPDDLEDAIAERRLTLISNSGALHEIVVRIGRPVRAPDHAEFACEYQIVGLGEGSVRRIYGVDAFQSLQLTLRFISTMLNYYRQESDGRIYWHEPGDNMGFVEVEPCPTSGK